MLFCLRVVVRLCFWCVRVCLRVFVFVCFLVCGRGDEIGIGVLCVMCCSIVLFVRVVL